MSFLEWRKLAIPLLLAPAALWGCNDQPDPMAPDVAGPDVMMSEKGGKPGGETAGNNLSYPVIWAEGATKAAPGIPGMVPILNGEWWYQWGTNGSDPNITPASCLPDPDEGNTELNPEGNAFCDDLLPGSLTAPAGIPLADSPLPLAKAYVQKDPLNVWQAGSADWSGAPVEIHWIDWGDNLESVDWYTRSQVRTEVVLFQDLATPMVEYAMRHTSGWGIDEAHGLQATLDNPPAAVLGEGTRATVYSNCARLTIQKLLVVRDDPGLGDLVWVPGEGWTEPEEDPNSPGSPYPVDLINPHIFNGSVHEGGDGPGYYSAEINVKGRIIFGYTWNVRNLHDDTPIPPATQPTAAGDYRITFSLDQTCGTYELNTYFVDGITEIMIPLEEEVAAAAEEGDDGGDTGGAAGVLDFGNNLTYMDIHILERGGDSGGGGGGGGPPSAKGGGGGGRGG